MENILPEEKKDYDVLYTGQRVRINPKPWKNKQERRKVLKEKRSKRHESILLDFQGGNNVEELSKTYCLPVGKIKKIVSSCAFSD